MGTVKKELRCPNCGHIVYIYSNPFPTVDIILEGKDEKGREGVFLIYRKNPPIGWALPGGFVDYGESLEQAAIREAREETSLEIDRLEQFYSYSDPLRDPRHHTITTVFIAKAEGRPKANDDAKKIRLFFEDNLPSLVFDHARILKDYFVFKKSGLRPNSKLPLPAD
ncbi:MAG: NUDIX hydrolase [Deltaproteobacteria bacterium]|nr:MAG: NUDIX hydrolase [Deltaproteobacteria bacterium]